ncbi:hypothetical protein BKA61DRAFT_658423 [Leptodontidium sp. MPI-SDFR-AT-0119]|nr:hypothetical protein BKA61DRAFT_658423 [Leptodontidium sp. MPI-SDFR-AT-0119]
MSYIATCSRFWNLCGAGYTVTRSSSTARRPQEGDETDDAEETDQSDQNYQSDDETDDEESEEYEGEDEDEDEEEEKNILGDEEQSSDGESHQSGLQSHLAKGQSLVNKPPRKAPRKRNAQQLERLREYRKAYQRQWRQNRKRTRILAQATRIKNENQEGNLETGTTPGRTVTGIELLIESLRLELAEAQIKLVESENMGGGRMQKVERLLVEARMTNAQLMEDNESYQLLLSEKTLTSAPASLADELSEAGEGESENYKRLESELKSAKDSNKALALYINKIIERLLQHQDFEAILDQSSDFKPGANTDKDLPPPPKEQASGASILQRAKSVAMGGTRRPRPQSQMPATHSALTDPDTAPSIPFGLGRSSSFRTGRPKSEQYTGGATSVVNQMYKGGPASPPLHRPQTPRHSQSFFAPPLVSGTNPNATHRVPSAGQVPTAGNFPGMKIESSSTSDSGDVSTPPSNSPPRAE